jgi:hypothetical protein
MKILKHFLKKWVGGWVAEEQFRVGNGNSKDSFQQYTNVIFKVKKCTAKKPW